MDGDRGQNYINDDLSSMKRMKRLIKIMVISLNKG